jgi:presequence protease
MSRTYTAGETLHGFVVERVQRIPELRSDALELRHVVTGARLIHIANDDPDNLFCCGFRTPVYDNTGVPHILEHSVLSGSRKYPFKEPFQQLLKSSLQTFLNALTYPDKTLYPVASQVEKDFYNLVDVYCDAMFHPLLTEHAFSQEGWHFDVEDPAKPVSLKGIVYNEMKGVFSDFTSHVARKTLSALYPDTTYFYESGGEPEHIPELTYEAFRAFHAAYYHPSNAFMFLYGNQSTAKTLEFLQTNYLSEYGRIEVDSEVRRQPLWTESKRMEIDAPAPREDAGTASVDVCWLFGDSTDPVTAFAGGILSRYLLGAESSPLRRALIDSKLGEDLDVICGFESEMVQGMFAAGLRKTKPEHTDAVRDIIFDTLHRQANGELDKELLEGSLRQAEFSLREISGGGRWPYSLKLADRCYRSWIYGGDPLCHLAFQSTLDTIRGGSIEDFFARVIREQLLDNPHHLISVIKASPEMGKRLERQTAEQAALLSAGFGDTDIERYHLLTKQLIEEQKRQPTREELSVLPRIGKNDLPRRNKEVPVERTRLGGADTYFHPLFCGGIAYLDVGFEALELDPELLPYLPLYTDLATRCGTAAYSYEQMATQISLLTGGISAGVLIDINVDGRTPIFKVFYHGKCLHARFGDMVGLMGDLLTAPKLDDTKLIGDILLEMRNDMHASIIGSGHSYATQHAAARLNRVRWLNEQLGGIAQLRFLEQLVKQNTLGRIIERMRELHEALVTSTNATLSLTTERPADFTAGCEQLLGLLPARPAQPVTQRAIPPDEPSAARTGDTGIEISSSVNFVAKGWALQAQEPRDAGTISLMSQNLSRGFLWDKVRVEGGAYGAFASMGSTYPVFTCASYRDPNISGSLRAFEQALSYAATQIDADSVDGSIVGTIGQVDKPRTPHAQGFSETCALLGGRTKEYRQQVREGILGATPEIVKTKAREILDARSSAITVLGSAAAFDTAKAEGVVLEREPLLGSEQAE